MIFLFGIIAGVILSFFFGVWLPDYREQRRMHRFTAEQIRAAAERCKRGE